jgi:DNA-binding XRE family transcriptional regulator
METHKNEDAAEREHSEPAIAKEREEVSGSVPGSDEGRNGSAAEKRVKAKPPKNNLRKLRLERMMSKAELARRAGVSTLTIDRVERGLSCRMDTKRKILEALGLQPSDRVSVFGEDE